MKNIKRRFEHFLFYDYIGIENHLNQMAAKGWQLEKITPFYWKYQRIKPNKFIHTVTYFSEASQFNPYPTDNQCTFHDYCKSAGWTLVTEWAQMQIFSTEQEQPTPIETDESAKLKAIHKAMKKNFLPGNLVMLLLTLFQIVFPLYNYKEHAISFFSDNIMLSSMAIWSILFIQILSYLLSYFIWYHKSKAAVDMGKTCIENSNRYSNLYRFTWLLLGTSILLAMLSLASEHFLGIGILGIANVVVVISLTHAIRQALKRENVSKQTNRFVTITCCIILSLLLNGVMIWGIIHGINAGWFFKAKVAETYTHTLPNGSTYTSDIYHDSLPLTVEDLQPVDYEHYSYQLTSKESFLLAQHVARQDSFPDEKLAPELTYTIVDVKFPGLFNLCLNEYLNQYDWRPSAKEKWHFLLTNEPAWKADAVYQLYMLNKAENAYILCWGNRIVFIRYATPPTSEQISITVEKLSK